ncbi:hypothetical protein BT67DRAFT_86253 [Trichocladium antarcticum]|uniref:2EXR domain-containing protein n=1 Tax=Trichocladium antarcticum TaxID=1450529 RepID=A0AAN6UIL5_9PEZI|nr:hypothetical protein BT67DRAFT_86253 [Trichocladium antarcticum]
MNSWCGIRGALPTPTSDIGQTAVVAGVGTNPDATGNDSGWVANEEVDQEVSEEASDTTSTASVTAASEASETASEVVDMTQYTAYRMTKADPTKPSFADFPYEIQAVIFKIAVADPQVIFIEISNGSIAFQAPSESLDTACTLSREIYLQNKSRHQFGNKFIWIEPARDIFYVFKDDYSFIQYFESHVVQNVALNLEVLITSYEPECVINRTWNHFHATNAIHIFVPDGPPIQIAPLPATPDTLILADIPVCHLVAAREGGLHYWAALKYQTKRGCRNIASHFEMGIFGHLTSLRATSVNEDAITEGAVTEGAVVDGVVARGLLSGREAN